MFFNNVIKNQHLFDTQNHNFYNTHNIQNILPSTNNNANLSNTSNFNYLNFNPEYCITPQSFNINKMQYQKNTNIPQDSYSKFYF